MMAIELLLTSCNSAVPIEETGLVFQFRYLDKDLTLRVTRIQDSSIVKVKIPSKVIYNDEEYFVTRIGNSAFRAYKNLTSVEIPNSVTEIGKRAFYGCTSLQNIEIGNSVTEIEDEAFAGCTSLTSIEIPNSVKIVGAHAFVYCEGLASVEIGNSVTTIGEGAFLGCDLTSIEIPNSVKKIGKSAFAGCDKLKKARVPDSCILEYDDLDSPFPSSCEIEWY